MNKWLYFVGGLALGAVGGILGYRFYLLKTYEDPGEEEDLSGYERFDDEEEVTVNPPMTDEEKEEIKERLEKNYEETTNYAAMYQGDAANHEHPVDSDEDEGEEPYDPEDLEELNEEDYAEETADDIALEETEDHAKTKGKKPKIISAEAVEDLPPRFENEILFYYTDDDVVVNDEENEEISNPSDILGDCLDKYGFRENDEERIFVVNYATDTCYEIEKIYGSWGG